MPSRNHATWMSHFLSEVKYICMGLCWSLSELIGVIDTYVSLIHVIEHCMKVVTYLLFPLHQYTHIRNREPYLLFPVHQYAHIRSREHSSCISILVILWRFKNAHVDSSLATGTCRHGYYISHNARHRNTYYIILYTMRLPRVEHVVKKSRRLDVTFFVQR